MSLALTHCDRLPFGHLQGQWRRQLRIDRYAGRIQEHQDKTLRHSDCSLAIYGQRWRYGMELSANQAFQLMALKPHKRLYFQRGLRALSLMQQAI